MNVLFLGPDGSGKSSLVEALHRTLEFSTKNIYLGMGRMGWEFIDLYNYARINRQFWMRKLFFYFSYWYLLLPIEFFARRLCIYSHSKKSVILIDRFPGTPFVKGGFLEYFYKIILPKPDLIVLLTGDPIIISQRKPDETTPERTFRELEKWYSVAKRISSNSIIILDTTERDIDSCIFEVKKEINNIFNKAY